MAGDKKKDAFVDTLKGKPVPRDMFGTIIGIGDYICWGTGAQKATGVCFGRVVKINLNKNTYGVEDGTRVSSVSCETVRKTFSLDERRKNMHKDGSVKVINGFHKANRKASVSQWKTAWVLDNPPKTVVELLDDNA